MQNTNKFIGKASHYVIPARSESLRRVASTCRVTFYSVIPTCSESFFMKDAGQASMTEWTTRDDKKLSCRLICDLSKLTEMKHRSKKDAREER